MGGAGLHLAHLRTAMPGSKILEQKLLIMKARIERRDTFEKIEFPGGRLTLRMTG